MRCVILMFDSLNRHMLPPYGGQDVHAPNFARLARRAATFDTSYVCSMPCMPARRDLHTGRPNFLHASWAPLDPYDDSVFDMLREQKQVHSHLVSDHYHYWEDGGANYHCRYDTWEFFRGQEGDPWIGQVAPPPVPHHINPRGRQQDWANRPYTASECDHYQTKTVAAGVAHIDRNATEDNWLLQIECFDPHEPFVAPRKYKDLYPSDYDGPLFDWPGYQPVSETPEQVAEATRNYKALVSMCDASLGDVLDAFDRHDLWKDTMLVVWTDHGFMLGEHGCWAKNWMPLYEEVSHTPLFIHDPRVPEAAGQRRSALVQPAVDLAPTLLNFFGATPSEDMLGHDLGPVVQADTPVRDACIFGYHGNRVNLTDGRYTYYRDAVLDGGADQYRLSTAAMRGRGNIGQIRDAELAEPFGFTKGIRPLRLPGKPATPRANPNHLLFDLHADPRQEHPLVDSAEEPRLAARMKAIMNACDSPPEQYDRMGL
ncbi:MAG: sulfatase-like hydrolase/transferase [Phycisphaerae bacterium]